MPNVYGAPEIDVTALKEKVEAGEDFILMDVREPHELGYAQLDFPQTTLVPLSRLAREQLNGLPESMADKHSEVVVMCHHGVRSAQVTAWLIQNGWENVNSLMGGIDAWAHEIDPAVGFY